MNNKFKAILYRFLRGGGFTALAVMATIAVPNYNDWNDIKMWIFSLIAAGIVGFISGGIQALDKWRRWTQNVE